MLVRLGVIADDLTGASDAGVQFARRGARVMVSMDWHNLPRLAPRADVLVLTTDSRALAPGAAAQRAKLAAQALRKVGVRAIYKKIDSTFRGNVGAELDAVLDVYPAPLAILTPSFPPAGRAVKHGILTVRGTPVHRSAAGRDPLAPVHESHLPRLLERQLGRPIYQLCLETLRGTLSCSARALRAWGDGPGGVVVADAITPQDLQRLAKLIAREQLFRVVAGSAGLAGAVAAVLTWRRRALPPRRPVRKPVLVVVGSPNPVSVGQIDWAEGRGVAAVVRALPREILGGRDRFERELDRIVEAAGREVGAARHMMLTLAQGPGQRGGMPARLGPAASGTLNEFLGSAARRLAQRTRLGALVLCGGDTAVAACRALGASGIELSGEVEPGVPQGRLVGGDLPGLPVVTKAGGFGSPKVFQAVIRSLRRDRAG